MADRDPISLSQALWRGFTGKCPSCGHGRLFRRFLKVADHCGSCGEALHHQRADDFPAYLVIVVVGHTIVPIMLAVETAYAPPFLLQFLVWGSLTVAMSVGLLQPTKGAVVGIQWQLGMDGFQASKEVRERNAAATVPDKASPYSGG